MWLHNMQTFTTATTNYTDYQASIVNSYISIPTGLTDLLIIIETINYESLLGKFNSLFIKEKCSTYYDIFQTINVLKPTKL